MLYENSWYTSVEAAYQASKTLDAKTRESFSTVNPSESKRMGRSVVLRENWSTLKECIMLDLLRIKFSNANLAQRLLDTRECLLIEGNQHHDTYWGVCRGVGKNRLGILLMQVRGELKDGALEF
jgi:ribA/ribD-fused uncharacterized protein